MSQKNGYIQIELRAGSDAICHIYPPTADGITVDFKAAVDYLKASGFEEYDRKELSRLLMSDRPSTLSLGESSVTDFSESMKVEIPLDKMEAVCTFYPPSFNGGVMNARDIMAAMEQKGVKFGIDQDAIIDFMSNREYFTPLVLAKGTQPVNGHNGRIDYFFNTDLSTKPMHNEDGSVDFHNLNTISQVQKGDLLARLIPSVKGTPGRNVVGMIINPVTVRDLRLQNAANTHITEDGLEQYSDVTGHAMLINDNIFVSDVYEVTGDVDTSTGNIEFDGNVHVSGSVRGGYSVIAKGDVIIEGVVEDALVQAEGQIVVRCGIHGMHKGILDAGGNVICKFIENARVFSGGYIETGAILYSEVSANESVIVAERKGFISGGIVRAGSKVEAMTIGSDMGASTVVEVGMNPEKKERYIALQKEMNEVAKNLEKLQPIVTNYEKYEKSGQQLDQKNQMYFQKVSFELKRSKQMLEADRTEFARLHKEMVASNRACVDVSRDVFPGVTVTISDVSVTMKDKRSFCRFAKVNGTMDISNL